MTTISGKAFGMRIGLALLALILVGASPPAAPVDLVPEFDRFVERTAADPMPARIAAFKARFGSLLPGFYPQASADDDPQIAKALQTFPTERATILAAAARARTAYADGVVRFGRTFPDYRPIMPVYVVHSLGEMDGGTRDVAGRQVLIFGADLIARIHAHESIDPFVDHELFHTYHARTFTECRQMWCSLWIEGLATHVAARLNPKASDSELLLDYPTPIRAVTDAQSTEAFCFTRSHLDATDPATLSLMFNGSSREARFAPRFGYYIGMRLAERIGRKYSLAELAHFSPRRVRRELQRVLDMQKGC